MIPQSAQFSFTAWGKPDVTQIDINSPKSAFFNEKLYFNL
jgi:hypothetical protein